MTRLGDLQVRGEKDFRWINGEAPARPAQIADLVSALRAVLNHIADLLWRLDAGPWAGLTTFSNMDEETKTYWLEQAGAFLDALAEAQPFPPAGR